MLCLCEHYMETANGWCCLERQRLLDENANLKEALARAKSEIKRLRVERTKAPLEGVFEEGTPSSQRLKETSPEERVARRRGARLGNEPHCRCAATEEMADEVRRAKAAKRTSPPMRAARPRAAKPLSRRPGFRACARSAPPEPCQPFRDAALPSGRRA